MYVCNMCNTKIRGVDYFKRHLSNCVYKKQNKNDTNFAVIKRNITLPMKEIGNITTPTFIKHSVLFPNTIQCIMVGRSGCGKTNL